MTTPASLPQSGRGNKPSWLRVRLAGGERYGWIKERRKTLGLATVCEEAQCPNIGECWAQGTATFMVLGAVCTRGCRFCAVTTRKQGTAVDADEPIKLAETIAAMELDYVVVTMVDRDDLTDGGAAHVVRCVEAANLLAPKTRMELLTGDFAGAHAPLEIIANGGASVLAHNIETVRRLTAEVRDARCGYDLSLDVLRRYRQLAPADTPIKSSIMVGLGESEAEVREALIDLRQAGVGIVTIGQYLRPSAKHIEVAEYVTPERFKSYELMAGELGFEACFSGPLVRSSYKAAEVYLAGRLGL